MPNDQRLHWEIRCTACGWQQAVEAMVPFTGQPPHPAKPHDPIYGFWEDYICPVHYQVTRRALVVSHSGLDLETAYIEYLSGRVETTPVPRCPVCQQTMQGGQTLSVLPFQLQPQIELQRWLIPRLEQLQRLVMVEAHALAQEDAEGHDPLTAHQHLKAEADILQQFYGVLVQQLDPPTPPPPPIEVLPARLDHWDETLADALQTARQRLAQLEQRHYDERQKTPGVCPACHQPGIHLRRATII